MYTVITSKTLSGLISLVNVALQNGYTLQGSYTYSSFTELHSQAVYKS